MMPKSWGFLRLAILKWSSFCSLILTLGTNKESLDSLLASHILVMLTMLFDRAPNIPPFVIGLSTCSFVDVVLATCGVVRRLETLPSTWACGGFSLAGDAKPCKVECLCLGKFLVACLFVLLNLGQHLRFKVGMYPFSFNDLFEGGTS